MRLRVHPTPILSRWNDKFIFKVHKIIYYLVRAISFAFEANICGDILFTFDRDLIKSTHKTETQTQRQRQPFVGASKLMQLSPLGNQ